MLGANARAICLHDLDFDRLPIQCRSTAGAAYTRWARVGMPRIPPKIVDDVFYLYRTVEEAKSGRNPGGSGFVVERSEGWHPFFYGVTNWHVAVRDGFSVIRLNLHGGGTDIIELGPEDWEFIPGKYDVAVVPLKVDERHQFSSVQVESFQCAPDPNVAIQIGVGEDVFMIGLFVDHGGTTTNVPSARFGQISMLPHEIAPIKQPTGFFGESFVVDMHSRTGFSGSPVFVYRTLGSDLSKEWHDFNSIEFGPPNQTTAHLRPQDTSGGSGTIWVSNFLKLLGIHWGQFPEEWELRERESIDESRRKNLILEGAYVEGMSGMTCVIPAWNILEVLHLDKFNKMQKDVVRRAGKPREPKGESAPPASDEHPKGRERFNSLLSAAARKREPKAET